jgi:L-tartrate/succinate antiporter
MPAGVVRRFDHGERRFVATKRPNKVRIEDDFSCVDAAGALHYYGDATQQGEAIMSEEKKARWVVFVPLAVTLAIALCPTPPGLERHAWYFFALFAGIIAELILESFPFAATGLMGSAIVAVLAPWVLFGPKDFANPKFNAADAAIKWMLTGWSSTTVWLVFSAFTFALGYEKSGLGRRIALILVKLMGRKTLLLGYAVMLSDALIAPFTSSNTARSGGIIFPIVRNLPELYDSKPHDPSSRKIGGYVMWVAFATTGVTSSMFLTALAPNLLCVEIIKKTANIDISWIDWFLAAAPFGIVMLLLLPLLVYWIYPPGIKEGEEVPKWAAAQLQAMGPVSRQEILLALVVFLAILFWIFGAAFINATTVALAAVTLMMLLKIVTWNDVAGNKTAWNTVVLLAFLVSLAEGLSSTGFIHWVDASLASHMQGFSPIVTMYVLVAIYFFCHYMFASTTPHTTAMMPVMLAVGMSVPGMPIKVFALLLSMTHGIMGVITPYATGPAPIYYGAGYIPGKDFWRLGFIFGVIFIAALLFISAPIMLATS